MDETSEHVRYGFPLSKSTPNFLLNRNSFYDHKHSQLSSMAGSIPFWIALIASFSVFLQGVKVKATTFEITNKCPYTVWAAAFPGGGKQLAQGQSWSVQPDAGTSTGRIWGRTDCSFDGSGRGTCQSGDCNGTLNCQGDGSAPVTLVEYTLNPSMNLDFYDISLLDGFNLPLSITPTSTNPNCKGIITCLSDINSQCPNELKVSGGCLSACVKYNTDDHCCRGANCNQTLYSRFFKEQCPQAYSYAKDDVTSAFTCPSGTDYKIVFCGRSDHIFALYLYITINNEE
ncbi:hypothetical protein SUGI_0264280 [Cryptomeria japonica]|uniref:pathogenesis-related thaumatin-like protein 3.6 n=1 Tax=Cryptomeria japonica TaxID=3369 RepID=UPI002408E0C1|nr:pathogenesis-related thaumatin-like protein 3.6 [Cryptomeria japonica]GLJ15970.1 hypothetical protein SUGI_0264280 [Cryptomeria japonica]